MEFIWKYPIDVSADDNKINRMRGITDGQPNEGKRGRKRAKRL